MSTVLAGASSAATLGNTPQPKIHHDNQNTGQADYKGPQTNYVKWEYQTGGDMISSSPAIGSDGTIYIGSNDGYLYALNKNGTRKWRFDAGSTIESSPAIDSDGMIYFGSNAGEFFALFPTGTKKWSNAISTDKIQASPAIGTDGTIYIEDEYGHYFAINSTNGNVKWQYPKPTEDDPYPPGAVCGPYSTPAIGTDGTIYIADGGVTALNPVDGTAIWSCHCINMALYTIYSSPAVDKNGVIYIGGMDNYLYAINPDGTQKWSYQTQQPIETTPAIANDGTIYVTSDDGNLYALTPSGSLKWMYDSTAGFLTSSPIIGSDGTIYVESNYVLCAFTPNGIIKWRNSKCNIDRSTPAIGTDGTLYIGTTYGSVMAFKDKTIAPTVTVNVKGGLYNTTKYITLKTTDPDSPATTYYTTDGSNPITSSTRKVYTKALTITHTTTLRFAAVDPDGNWKSYTEKYTIDTIPPKVKWTIPVNNKTRFSKTATLSIKFAENIKYSLMYNHITVKNLKTKKYMKITKSILNSTLTIRTSKRSPYTWYQVTIPSKAIKDYAGNNLKAMYIFRFKTGA